MRIRTAIAAAALLVSGAAQAQQRAQSFQDRAFCRDLDRAIRAAPDFTFLARAAAAPPRFGFRQGCRAYPGTERLPAAWECSQNLAPEHMSGASLAARTAACLPEAQRTRGSSHRESLFTVPNARIRITETGGPRAHVGRIVTLRVEATER